MFKRSGAIVLTMLYLVTVVGFALNLHYCGKIITAIKIDAPAKSCASNLMAGKMKCCHDKQIDIKIKDAHQGEFPSFLGKLFSFHIAKLPFANAAFYAQAVTAQHIADRRTRSAFKQHPRLYKKLHLPYLIGIDRTPYLAISIIAPKVY